MKIKFLILLMIWCLSIAAGDMPQRPQFKATEKTCGAAVAQEGQESVIDDINSRVECMIHGFKNVYLGFSNTELNELRDEYKPLSKYSIKILTIPGGFILYTPVGEKNARLLAKYRTKITRENHYLQGLLLGYKIPDIEYFYNRLKSQQRFLESDKEAAYKFIEEYTPQIEDEIKQAALTDLLNPPQLQDQQPITIDISAIPLNELLEKLKRLLNQLKALLKTL